MDISSVCRCCLNKSEAIVKNLFNKYVCSDSTEIYSDMLKGCFNIGMTKLQNSNICDDCIGQLRAALRFKEQVLFSEREFLKQLHSRLEIDDKPLEMKVEPKSESDNDSDDYFLADAVAAREVPVDEVKSEVSEVRKKSETVKKPVKKDGSRAQKIRTLVSRLATSMDSCAHPDTAALKTRAINQTVNTRPPQRDPTDDPWTPRAKKDKKKHKSNLQTILNCSNAVPFANKSLLGFICAYCKQAFPDPADLRTHSLKDHKERINIKPSSDMREYNVKLDVADLNCTLCGEKMNDLTALKNHLVQIHKKTIYNDVKDHMIQFKLKKGNVYDCALCSSTYETFKMLKQHMNMHYPNYSCKKCDSSFATKPSLVAHKTIHANGKHKCPQCDKVFCTRPRRDYHVKTIHSGGRCVSNCPFCDEPFRHYYQRNQHLIKVHNAEALYKCNVCNKAYILKSLLMYHIKKTHLMEKNVQCKVCGYKVFSKKALSAHMVKHTGEKKYVCEVCHKAYARKYTLREHLRIHSNDRRFKCSVCAMSFVQKCSLKSHLLSNHGISMAACDITSTE